MQHEGHEEHKENTFVSFVIFVLHFLWATGDRLATDQSYAPRMFDSDADADARTPDELAHLHAAIMDG